MTISSATRKAGPYTANGIQVDFVFAFKVFQTSEVVVTQTVVDVETVLSTGYSVALNADQDNNPGGTVTFVTAPTSTYLITLSSAVIATQSVQLTNGGAFYPSVLNAVFDRLTILSQQTSEILSRALVVSISSTQTPAQLLASIFTAQTNAASSATSAAGSATAASNSAILAATNASLSAASFSDSSSTSNSISTGSKSFTISANKNFRAGQFVIMSDTNAPTVNYMSCQITSYNSTTGALVVNSLQVAGTGTFTSWSVSIGGALGIAGTNGTNGTNGIGLTWKGTWSGATAYVLNDAVTNGTDSYVCLLAHTNQAVSNGTYWQKMAAQGATGPQGAGVLWKGAWSGATAYALADAVNYSGSSYVCKLAHTNNVPPNTTYWDVLAQVGSNGSGSGDASTNTSASVVNEIVLFADTAGKTLKRNTLSGLAKMVSGVLSAAVSGTDYAPATSGSAILKGNAAGGFANAVSNTDYQAPIGTISGIVKGNGANALIAAVSNTDYQAPIGTISGLAKGNGANALTAAVANTDYLPVASPVATGSIGVPKVDASQGADVASAATLNLETATGQYVKVTGTTGITAITLSQGHERTVVFAGTLTLTNGASLILPGGANITTLAGDSARFVGEAAGVVRCIGYTKASGAALVAQTGTLIGYQVITATGSYDKNINSPSFVVVEGVGGGGGSGGVSSAATGSYAGGGGAGGYFLVSVAAASLGATETVTIGAAGTAGAISGTSGGTGGTTSFGAWASATGGAGTTGITAASTFTAGGAGGVGSGGTLNQRGGCGGAGSSSATAVGGNSFFCGGGVSGVAGSSVTAVAGLANSGGGASGPGSNKAGAIGGSGVVIIWEYK